MRETLLHALFPVVCFAADYDDDESSFGYDSGGDWLWAYGVGAIGLVFGLVLIRLLVNICRGRSIAMTLPKFGHETGCCASCGVSSKFPSGSPSALTITGHTDERYNGVYKIRKDLWNERAHYVNEKEMQFYFYNQNEGGIPAWSLDDNDQPNDKGAKDWFNGGFIQGAGLLPPKGEKLEVVNVGPVSIEYTESGFLASCGYYCAACVGVLFCGPMYLIGYCFNKCCGGEETVLYLTAKEHTNEMIRAEDIPGGAASVQRAWYGPSDQTAFEGDGADVTDKVKDRIAQGQDLIANNNLWGDPASGQGKTLTIDVRHRPQSCGGCKLPSCGDACGGEPTASGGSTPWFITKLFCPVCAVMQVEFPSILFATPLLILLLAGSGKRLRQARHVHRPQPSIDLLLACVVVDFILLGSEL